MCTWIEVHQEGIEKILQGQEIALEFSFKHCTQWEQKEGCEQ
jgi:hypothetical protein